GGLRLQVVRRPPGGGRRAPCPAPGRDAGSGARRSPRLRERNRLFALPEALSRVTTSPALTPTSIEGGDCDWTPCAAVAKIDGLICATCTTITGQGDRHHLTA